MKDKQQELEMEAHVDEQSTTTTTKQLSQEEIIKTYVENEENKANHLKIAEQLNKVFPNKWFTIDMIANKTLMKDKKQISEMMLALQLFNMVVAKQGGVNFKHKTKFKILLTAEDRLKVLDEHKNNHLKQIELIEVERQKLLQEINERAQNEK